ncbi:MAG: hypothetical protein IJI39_02910, partial [Clostridia bacterium]|nr:hypothetical protein [Clostridia bacterium]
NDKGQLGRDTTLSYGPVPEAINLGGKKAKALAAGDDFAVAVDEDGTIWTWGSNEYGQLGINDTTTEFSNSPQHLTIEENGTAVKFINVAAGMASVYALTETGSVYSWGYSAAGQLGNGATSTVWVPRTVIKGASASESAVIEDVIRIDAGDQFVIVLKRNNDVFVWGDNTKGSLGNRSDGTQKNVPVQVHNGAYTSTAGDSFIHEVGDVYAGGSSAAVIVNHNEFDTSTTPVSVTSSVNTVYTWGDNANGQLGLSDTLSPASTVTTPAQVTLANVRTMAVGSSHMLAADTNDLVYSWGSNSNGQLGNGKNYSELASVRAPVQVMNGETRDVISTTQFGTPMQAYMLGAGKNYSMAIMETGRGYAWGSNTKGHIGDYSKNDKVYPTQIGKKELDSLLIQQAIVQNNGSYDTIKYATMLPSEIYMSYEDSTKHDILMVDVHQIYSNVDGNFNLFDALGVNNVLQTGVTAANFSLLNPGLFTIDTSLAAYNGNEYVVIRPNTSNLFGTTT